VANRLTRSLVTDPRHGPLPALLLLLTATTGVVDAVSILSLGRVFVANMTGNVVFVGFALVGAPGFSLAASLFALAGFLVGAFGGGAVISRLKLNRVRLLRDAVATEVAAVAVALVVAAAAGTPVGHGPADAMAAVLAVALGLQNAVVRRLAVSDLTTTVLTPCWPAPCAVPCWCATPTRRWRWAWPSACCSSPSSAPRWRPGPRPPGRNSPSEPVPDASVLDEVLPGAQE
jgi:hypothetical protein